MSDCQTCHGRGKVQAGYAGEELADCPDCTPCHECGGSGGVDSGGFTPWGAPIDLPCPSCAETRRNELCRIGAAWKKDSSLERWFPLSAEELKTLRAEKLSIEKDRNKFVELNGEKFLTIQAYCRMASMDKWKIGKLIEAIDQYISAAGYNDHTKLLTEARADVVNSKVGLL